MLGARPRVTIKLFLSVRTFISHLTCPDEELNKKKLNIMDHRDVASKSKLHHELGTLSGIDLRGHQDIVRGFMPS